MQIGYLGPLEVRDGQRIVDVPGRRLRTLLSRLATDVGRPVPARTLIDALWPDEAPGDPANALQSLVSRLRRTLGDPGVVEQLPGGYRLGVEPDDVDAVRFARLAATGRAQLVAGSCAEASETLCEALALWRGDPLPDDDSVEAEGVRARLHELRLQARADRIEADLSGRHPGDPADLAGIIAELEQLVAEHPLREDLTGLRMRALVLLGRPAEALVAYENTRTYLADTLGSDPSPALREQHLAVLRAQDGGPPSRKTNLRAALTSFVGRDEAAARVDELLQGQSRLVTIVGTGGAGKTRLASEVAATWVGRAPDGVWFAELAPVTDPDNVPLAVLDGLGIRELAQLDRTDLGERPLLEARDRVLQALVEAECLVVIDNCEHVVDAAAGLVAEVLGKCPGVRIIATSREPLGINGETLYALTPLALPDPDSSPAQAETSAAVRLLLDRAKASGADLRLDDDTVADVVEVVRRLDGLPLAIELAAARLRVLSIAEVAERLADRFRLLTGGRRTAMPRHRTLRAVVEWSWDLLTPLEREVAEHFSVFSSGATADAVAAVCPSAGGDSAEIEDVLYALVDRSLLVAGRDGGSARFRMLETLREYGSERLVEQGTLEAARLAHATYYADLMRTADRYLRTADQSFWLRRVDSERDNALTALAYLGEHDQAVAAVEMAVCMAWGWMLRENGKDSTRWLGFALEAPGADASPLFPVAQALHIVTAFSSPGDGGDGDHRDLLVKQSDRMAPAEELHDLVPLLRPLLLFFAQERDRALELADRNVARGNLWTRAATRTIRVSFRENDGDVEGMREDVELALAEWTALGDHWGLSAILTARGQLRTLDGDTEGAAEDFERALHEIRLIGGNVDDLLVNMRLADLSMRAGDFEGARRYAEAVAAHPDPGDFGYGHGILGDVMRGAIALEEGDEATLAANRVSVQHIVDTLVDPTVWHSHAIAVGYAFLCTADVRAGELEAARIHAAEGVFHALRTKDSPIIATMGVAVASYAQAIGAYRPAAVILGAAAQLRGSDDHTALTVVRVRTQLEDALGEDYAGAYAEGRSMTRDDALARLDPALLD